MLSSSCRAALVWYGTFGSRNTDAEMSVWEACTQMLAAVATAGKPKCRASISVVLSSVLSLTMEHWLQ